EDLEIARRLVCRRTDPLGCGLRRSSPQVEKRQQDLHAHSTGPVGFRPRKIPFRPRVVIEEQKREAYLILPPAARQVACALGGLERFVEPARSQLAVTEVEQVAAATAEFDGFAKRRQCLAEPPELTQVQRQRAVA